MEGGTSPNDGTEEHGDEATATTKRYDDFRRWARHRARHVLWLKQATAAAAASTSLAMMSIAAQGILYVYSTVRSLRGWPRTLRRSAYH